MKVDFAPATLEEELAQNIACIIETVVGTVPLARSFGLDSTFVDSTSPFVESQMTNQIISAVQEFEPRATVTEVIFAKGEDGQVKPMVKYKQTAEGGDEHGEFE